MKSKIYNGFFHAIEFLFIYVLVNNAYLLAFHPPTISAIGPIVEILGAQYAIIFYALVYAVLGILLLVSKLGKFKKLHQYSLYGITLTMLFIFFIELVVVGWGVHLIDTAVIFVLVSWAYLRWKLKIGFVSPKQFEKDIEHLTKE